MSHLHYILFRPPSGQVYKISKDWHFYLEVFMPPTYKEHIHNGKCYFTVRTNRVPTVQSMMLYNLCNPRNVNIRRIL